MKITSCECFEKIKETIEKSGKNLEIKETFIDEDMNMKAKEPIIYFKVGKDGIKKKDYVSLTAKYCPICGKKIEVE